MSTLVLLATILIGLFSVSSAYTFYVGGNDGWVQNPKVSYSSWAGRLRFQVHDKLVFKYKNTGDSVLVVKKEDFDSCNVSSPIEKLELGGDSVFEFNRTGPSYFISGVKSNCEQGEKLVVIVLAQRNKKPSNPTTPPTSSPSPSSASQPPSSGNPSPSLSPKPSSSSSSPTSAPSPSSGSQPPSSGNPSPSPSPSLSPKPSSSSSSNSPTSSPSPSSGSQPPASSGNGGTNGGDSPSLSPKPSSSSSSLTVSSVIIGGLVVALVLGHSNTILIG